MACLWQKAPVQKKIFPSHYRDVSCSFGFRTREHILDNNSIVSLLIPLFLIVRAKILSLSLFLLSFLPSLSFSLSSSFSLIYIKKNLTTKILPIEKVRSIGELLLTRSTTPIQNQREIYSFNSLVFTREKSHPFQHPRVDTGKENFAINLS